ncbi:hypothetical protein NBRC116592_22370 [Colwellia sp. KU-HH00111]|uniref:DUF3081 family protein n=1 Tax=Colwellia sp. KU-HH00111 TaxID=3127652 RepID=UPI00310799FD
MTELTFEQDTVIDKITTDKRNLLHVFNVIRDNGVKVNQGYELQGIKAWHDFDGYQCWLSYHDLTVTLLFHNKYQFDYSHDDTVANFTKLVDNILKKY